MKQTLRLLFLLLLAFTLATTVFAQELIAVGDEVDGEADNDIVEYEIELAADDAIIITLESDDFDPIVRILDEDEEELDMNDDGPDMGYNSQLEFTAEDDAVYIIVVDAFGDDPDGDFTLTVEAADGEDSGNDSSNDNNSSGDVSLAYGDEEDFDADGLDELEITFEGAEGDVVTIIARPDEDQDLKITLLDPDDDDIAVFDEFTFGNAALIRVPLEADGVYTIVIEERNGEELVDDIEVELIETELLDLGEGPQSTSVSSDVGLDYMFFEAEDNAVYLILVTLDGDIDSGLDINIFEEGDSTYFAPVSVGVTGIEESAFLFEATDDGIVTVQLDYFAFSNSEIDVTIEIELQD